MQKGNVLIFLLVGIVVLAAIGGAFYLGRLTITKPSTVITSQTPSVPPILSSSEPTDWKIYSSPCGFSIKYPSRWNAQKYFLQDSTDSCAFLTAPDYSQGLDSRDGFYVQIYVTNVGSSVKSIQSDGSDPKDVQVNNLDDLINATWSDLNNRPDIMKKIADKTYGVFTGKQFPACCYESLNDFAFIHGNNIYEVQWPVDSETGKINSSYGININQILSTFKFTQ